MEILGVIPARFASTRLPGKPLLAETGKPLIQHVYEAARAARCLTRVLVATDDARIAAVVRGFGGAACMTRADHQSGTDRVAEVARTIPSAAILVNIQGDEPELSPHAVERVVELLLDNPAAGMSTLATPIRDRAVYHDPACVKVVVAANGHALYFSRAPIPHHRDGAGESAALGLLHLGLYAYRRAFLLEFAGQPATPLEQTERLEQLRALESGRSIAVGIVEEPSIGIDTPDDYRRFVERQRARANGNAA